MLIGQGGTSAGHPPEELVRVAFGTASFGAKAGMYIGGHLGLAMSLGEHLEFAPLIKDDRYVVGGLFKVGGVLLCLWLDPAGPSTPLSHISGIDEQWSPADLKWRFRKIQVKHGRYLSHVIEFRW